MALTESALKIMFNDTIRVYEQLRRFASDNSSGTITNFLATQATLQGDTANGDYVPELLARVTSTRNRIDGALRESAAAMDSCLRMYAQVLSNVPEIDAQSIISRLYDDAIANNKRVTSRGFLFGAYTNVGSPVGTGVIYRNNKDENGLAIENQHADTKNARCISDASSGAAGRNEEVFEVRGSQASRDSLALSGSGARITAAAISARASAQLMQNPSFSTVGGTATVPTSIPGWTSSVTVNAANYQFLDGSVGGTVSPAVQGSIIYRDFPGDSIPYALQCLNTAGWSLTQSLEVNRPNLSTSTPYFLSFAFKKSASNADGTLTLSLGGSTISTTSLSSAPYNDTAWHVVVLGDTIGVPGRANWYKNFNAANLTMTISRQGSSVGTITIDDVIFAPMVSFDGSWYTFLGGSTQWKRYDQYTWADSSDSFAQSQIQTWLWRSYGRYYPACPPNISATPSVALLGGGAGNVDNGAHSYQYSSVDLFGQESAPTSTVAVTVVDKTTNGKVFVTALTGANTAFAHYNIYRSKAATTTPLYLVGTTTGSTFTDNIADSALPATVPVTGVTWLEP